MSLWNQKTCLLVTGASRGIGRTIAVEFSKLLAPNSLIILTARNTDALNETKSLINPNIRTKTHSIDLQNTNEKELSDICNINEDFEQVILVHNAGSLGNLDKWSMELDTLKELQDYFMVNVFSMILLNNLFLKQFPRSKRLVINITSLWAVQPSSNFVLYCCGKATREMYFKVLVEENPDIRAVSYSPGPVLTDMADEILDGIRCENLKARFVEMRTSGTYLKPEQTVARLQQILEADKYVSGAHVDYFDSN